MPSARSFFRRFSNNGRGIRRIQPFPRTGLLFRLEYGYRGVLPVAALHTFFILSAEIKYVKKGYDEPQKEKARKRLFRVQSALLFATDISLIAPITLMVLQKRKLIFLRARDNHCRVYHLQNRNVGNKFFKGQKERKSQRKNAAQRQPRRRSGVRPLPAICFGYDLWRRHRGRYAFLCAFSSLAVWGFLIILSVVNAVKSRKNNTRPRETVV